MFPGWHALFAGLRRLFHRSTADRDLDDEVRQYVEQAAEAYRQSGLSPEEALRAARVEIGSAAAVKDRVRASGWETTCESIWRDVVYGVRMLRRAPGFTAVAVIVLALSIGANTAVFSIVNAVLLRPPAVRAPGELVFAYGGTHNARSVFTFEEVRSLGTASDVFTGAAATSEEFASLDARPDTLATAGEAVTGNYFDLLGVGPQLGRLFVSTLDEARDAPPVMVISDRLWRRRFNADPNILGQAIRLGRSAYEDSGWRYTIVGVTKPEFNGVVSPWMPTDYWIPALQGVRENGVYSPRVRPDALTPFSTLIGRRQAGVTITRVRALIESRHKAFEAAADAWTGIRYSPGANRSIVVRDSRRVRLPLDDAGRIEPSRLAATLMGVAALVLLIGVTNLVGVTIGRGIMRRSEMAVRLSLGASRARVARQLVIEGLLLSLLGGLGGLVGSRWLVDGFLASLPNASAGRFGPLMLDVSLDVRVLLFTILVVVATGVAVGLAPVRHASNRNLLAAIGAASEIAPRRVRSRLRYWIVVPQICLCMALLLAAGIAVRALLKVALLDPGYEPDRAASVAIQVHRIARGQFFESQGEQGARLQRQRDQLEQLKRRLLEIAETTPTIAAAGLTTALPFSWLNNVTVVTRDGFSRASPHHDVYGTRVTPGYFDAVGVPLRLGRTFARSDARDTPLVALVDESLATRLWAGKSPIGQYLGFHHPASTQIPAWLEVVGVVGSVRTPLSEGEPHPLVYTPMAQESFPLWINGTTLVARTRGSVDDLVKTLRAVALQADANAVVSGQTLIEAIDTARYPRRMTTSLLVSSGLVGLLLASLGLYGVVSHSVAQRMKELGIRAALGADRSDLIALVMREGAIVVLIGSMLGLALAFVGIRIVSHNVFAIPPMDGITMIAVPLILAAVVLLACYLPARRAALVDPMVVLRWL